MAQKLRLGVVYDFRNPPESGMRTQDLYAAVMEQVVWLDGLGLDLVWFTEHHFVDDGYLPSWIPVAAAMAARTQHMRFSCDVCLLPFNLNPAVGLACEVESPAPFWHEPISSGFSCSPAG